MNEAVPSFSGGGVTAGSFLRAGKNETLHFARQDCFVPVGRVYRHDWPGRPYRKAVEKKTLQSARFVERALTPLAHRYII
jgi:hypothetical protein